MARFEIKEVAEAALASIEIILGKWLPNGSFEGAEYCAINPARSDKSKGSFKVNRNTGAWSDFATGDKGGDLVALVAYIDRVNQGDACQRLGEYLGLSCAREMNRPGKVNAGASRSDSWELISPVPEDALKNIPKKHYSKGAPSLIWHYLDSAGRTLMLVARFDYQKNGKQVKDCLPLTYRKRSNSNEMAWRWQWPEKNRPLYGLDSLAKSSKAKVLIVEGEKACDAAKNLYPSVVCMTWPAGSKAVSKANFSPLSGREVTLWPDNDLPGKECMNQLGQILLGLGCKVKSFNLDAFDDKWPEGADAADAITCGYTPEKLKELAKNKNLIVPFIGNDSKAETKKNKPGKVPQPKMAGFLVSEKGVFIKNVSYDENGENKEDLVRVCDRLEVVAASRDKQKGNWGMLVRFVDPDKTPKDWNIPNELLATEGGTEILRQLLNMGLRIEPGQHSRRRLIEYLHTRQKQLDENQRVTLVHKLGWHSSAYLLPEKLIGKSEEELYFYSPVPELNKHSQSGTLADWQNKIAKYCSENPLLMFAVSAAFAAPLLHLVGMDSTGFHYYGDSSQGKTTLLKVAASVYGPPEYLRTWRSTDNALESIAAAHSDGLLILDEISQCDPRIVGDITYMLGNGKGKARANDRGTVRASTYEWRLIFLSTGERTLEQQMAEVGKKVKAGQEARLLAIPANAGEEKGIFNQLHQFAGGAALSKYLAESSSNYYGQAFIKFIEKLVGENLLALSSRLRSYINSFSGNLDEGASGQVVRASDKFALIAFAGELATSFGVTGWSQGEADKAVRYCFDSWLKARGGVGNLEDQQILKQIKLFFELYGESNFTRWERDNSTVDEHAPRTMKRYGFRKTLEDSNALADGANNPDSPECSEVIYFVLPGAFRTELCNGIDDRRAKKLLADCGAIERDSQGNYSVPKQLPGYGRKRQRVYLIRPHLIPDFSGDSDQ